VVGGPQIPLPGIVLGLPLRIAPDHFLRAHEDREASDLPTVASSFAQPQRCAAGRNRTHVAAARSETLRAGLPEGGSCSTNCGMRE